MDEPGYSFLEKRTFGTDKGSVSMATAATPTTTICLEDMEEDEEAKMQCADIHCLVTKREPQFSCVYHVVYSQSYNVPVLFFNMHHSDGRLFTLEEVWQQVPQEYQNELFADRWGAITQQEHPLLGQPYFGIHPCQTQSLMSQIPLENDENYIISWLSTFGPLVGLKMPLSYATFSHFNKHIK